MMCGYIGGPISDPSGNGAEDRDDMGETETRSPRKKKLSLIETYNFSRIYSEKKWRLERHKKGEEHEVI